MPTLHPAVKPTLAALSAFLLALLAGCTITSPATTAAPAAQLSGILHGGRQPITGARIQLYAVSTAGDASAATPLIASTLTTSDGSSLANSNANPGNANNTLPAGSFTITNDYTCPTGGANVYLVGTGGNAGSGSNNRIALMAALGSCSSLTSSSYVFLDELTTVGSVAALYPYMASYNAIGSGSSDSAAFQTAFAAVNQYTNTATGAVPGITLPASYYASTIEIQTLADAIAACVNSSGGTAGDMTSCGSLFSAATVGASIPTDTIGATLNILKNPASNVCAIFSLAAAQSPYQPTLTACPTNWLLPINQLTIAVNGATSVYQSATSQYTATVTGATNGQTAVTWAVNGITGGTTSTGTISASGLYTAPATVPSSAVTIAATSTLSSTATGSSNVTVAPVTVAVAGPANVLFSQTGTYTATVTGSSTSTVTWQVNGVSGGSSAQGFISTSGVYTAPATAPSAPVVISATSTAVSTASGSTSITVSPTAVTYATGDSRTVTQPTNPAICATLYAQFSTAQRSAPPAAAADDTTRIQNALNSAPCKSTGQSVELAVSGSNNAFFSEEITLNGQGLTLDSGVTLYGGSGYSTQSYLVYIKGTNSSLVGPGTVDGRGDLYVGSGSSTRLVEAQPTSNLTIYNVTLQQAIYPNLYIQGGNGATVWGVTILTPATRANADGIDLDSLTNATVINSTVEDGDDGIAVKTNSSAASNITIANNKFYGTHGISIGSQTFKGVSNILFTGNTLYGTDLVGNLSADPQGVNIKTDPTCGGTVQQVTYQNTCLSGVKHLIVLNTAYGACSGTAGTPQFTDIIVNGVYSQSSISGAYSLIDGGSAYPINAYLANISLDNVSNNSSNQWANISLSNSNFTPAGPNITTSAFSTPGSIPTCSF